MSRTAPVAYMNGFRHFLFSIHVFSASAVGIFFFLGYNVLSHGDRGWLLNFVTFTMAFLLSYFILQCPPKKLFFFQKFCLTFSWTGCIIYNCGWLEPSFKIICAISSVGRAPDF